MFILLSGQPPFDGIDDAEIIDKIRIGKYSMDKDTWGAISVDAKATIKRMLTIDYQQRPYAKDTMEDTWFSNATKKPIDPD